MDIGRLVSLVKTPRVGWETTSSISEDRRVALELVAAAARTFARVYESVDCGQEELCLSFLNAALDELDKGGE